MKDKHPNNEELARLKAQVAALQELLEIHEQTTLEHSDRLEQALTALTKRANELEVIAHVSTAISTILDTSTLLYTVVDLVKERFALYHAHIYLLNQAGDTLNLAAGAGEIGRQMTAQGWKISLGRKHSLVAGAARARQVVISNDVAQSLDFLRNPLLPETCSEMAMPIIVGNSLLGVLDVQANEVDHFTEEDSHIMTILAAQVAVAVQNASLFEQMQQTRYLLAERVKELDCLNDIGREAEESPSVSEFLHWVTERVPPAMRYPEACVVAIEFDGQAYGKLEAINLPQQMAHGIRVGGEVVGRIYIAYTKKQDFINEESMFLGGVARRVSAYIESRRLFERTQARAQREQLLREVTARVRSSVDADTIMRTAVQEVGRALGRPAFVYLGNQEE
ncbi:MAG: GAF domain-containing protein [Chloroflexi bacterium]|nr:GAF domain-containing protein [Chloroflexota bacterium]